MEIMIKAKQKYNPFFSFVSLYDPLHSYYRLLLQMIASGDYSPKLQAVKGSEEVEHVGKSEAGEGVIVGEGGGVRREDRKGARRVSQTGEDESEPEDSDDEYELHPLLRISTTPRSSPKPPSTRNSSAVPTTTATPSSSTATTGSNDHLHSLTPSTYPPSSVPPSSTMPSYSKSLIVNSAPSLERETRDTMSSSRSGYPHPSSLER